MCSTLGTQPNRNYLYNNTWINQLISNQDRWDHLNLSRRTTLFKSIGTSHRSIVRISQSSSHRVYLLYTLGGIHLNSQTLTLIIIIIIIIIMNNINNHN